MRCASTTMGPGSVRHLPAVAGIAIALLLSCSLSLERYDLLLKSTAGDGSYLRGIRQIRKNKDLYGTTNRLLYHMDQGLLFQYAGEVDSSLDQLGSAEKVEDELYTRSVTNEAAAILSNDLVRPYRLRRYERVLLHQFMAFDYLAQGRYDDALVETRKVQLVFDSYKSSDQMNAKYNDDGMTHYLSSIVYDAQRQHDDATIALFDAVKAYEQSPLKLPEPVSDLAYYRLDADNRQDDITQLGLTPKKPAENVPGIADSVSEIILVGYGGTSPRLAEAVFEGTFIEGGLIAGMLVKPTGEKLRMVLPAPPLPESEIKKLDNNEKTAAGTTFHIKIALPEPVSTPSRTAHFRATLDDSGAERRSISLTSTEKLLEQDIDDNRGITLARTAVRVVLRTIAAQKTKQQLETSSPVANVLINLGADALTDQLERADTRLCFLLPRTIQVVRIRVAPGTHRIRAEALDKNDSPVARKEWPSVTVKEGEKKFVFFPALL